MKLLTAKQNKQMIANGIAQEASGGMKDFKLVVKIFTPWTNCVW